VVSPLIFNQKYGYVVYGIWQHGSSYETKNMTKFALVILIMKIGLDYV